MRNSMQTVADNIVGTNRLLPADFFIEDVDGSEIGFPEYTDFGRYKMRGASIEFIANKNDGLVLYSEVIRDYQTKFRRKEDE